VEIEDIVQETYVRVCQIERKEEIRAPRSFLYKTARNLALDYAKRAETRLADSWDDVGSPALYGIEQARDETFDRVASDAEFSRFCEAVRHLPVQCRRVFVLKKVYGFSQREISRELSISESTVEKHIAQGIKRCSYYMVQHENQSNRMKSVAGAKQKIPAANSDQGGSS
jgi:RNA polymerase sigma-70 factor (ECF subfamily)